MAQLDTSRRCILGALAAAPAAALAGSVAAMPLAGTALGHFEWDAAFAHWQQANDTWVTAPLELDSETETANMEREHGAWRALFATPAPHIAALHWKLAYLFGDDDGGQWDPAITKLVLADAARLAKLEG